MGSSLTTVDISTPKYHFSGSLHKKVPTSILVGSSKMVEISSDKFRIYRIFTRWNRFSNTTRVLPLTFTHPKWSLGKDKFLKEPRPVFKIKRWLNTLSMSNT